MNMIRKSRTIFKWQRHITELLALSFAEFRFDFHSTLWKIRTKISMPISLRTKTRSKISFRKQNEPIFKVSQFRTKCLFVESTMCAFSKCRLLLLCYVLTPTQSENEFKNSNLSIFEDKNFDDCLSMSPGVCGLHTKWSIRGTQFVSFWRATTNSTLGERRKLSSNRSLEELLKLAASYGTEMWK